MRDTLSTALLHGPAFGHHEWMLTVIVAFGPAVTVRIRPAGIAINDVDPVEPLTSTTDGVVKVQPAEEEFWSVIVPSMAPLLRVALLRPHDDRVI